MFTCILGFLILGETKPWSEIYSLLAVFFAVIVILTGATGEQAELMDTNFWVFVALIAQPMLIA